MNLLTLPTILAQATDITYQQPEVNPLFGAVFGIIWLVVVVLIIASYWKIFTKAGQPGWAAIVPIYNLYILCKISGKSGWWVILICLPFIGAIFWILLNLALAEKFGKGAGFGVGLALLFPIFYPILAFGDARYQGAGVPLPGAAY